MCLIRYSRAHVMQTDVCVYFLPAHCSAAAALVSVVSIFYNIYIVHFNTNVSLGKQYFAFMIWIKYVGFCVMFCAPPHHTYSALHLRGNQPIESSLHVAYIDAE